MTSDKPNGVLKVVCRESLKYRRLLFGPIILSFWFIFLNLQSYDAEGLDFCYDGSKEGYRLDANVIKYIHTESGIDCIMQCVLQDESCKSANFRKTSEEKENCEFLNTVDSEEPAERLKKDENFDYYKLVQSDKKPEGHIPTNTPQITQTTVQPLLSSCKEVLEKNGSSPNGKYTLKNNVTHQQYEVYCHMSEISKCGKGGWTLVMKVDGNKRTFNYNSFYWTNKTIHSLKDGLEGLTKKETKLASYWNTPFNKICFGMKVDNNSTRWIMIDHQASSLFKLIQNGNFTSTNVGIRDWGSLIVHESFWRNKDHRQGFNFCNEYIYARIGVALTTKCHAFLGLGTSFRSGNDEQSSITCGYALCRLRGIKFAAFGYILVQ